MNLLQNRHGKALVLQTLNGVGGNVGSLTDVVIINNGSSTTNIIMPPAASMHGRVIYLKRASNTATGTIKLKGNGAEKVERSTGVFNNLYTWAAATRNAAYVCNGIEWHLLHYS